MGGLKRIAGRGDMVEFRAEYIYKNAPRPERRNIKGCDQD